MYHSINDLFKNFENIRYLWEPYFPEKGVALIAGGSDTGKSLFMMQFCLSLMSEKTFLGSPIHPKHRKFLYLSTEDDGGNVGWRITKMANAVEVPHHGINDPCFSFEYDDLVGRIAEQLEKEAADIVVIDTYLDALSVNTTGTASNSADMT